MGLLCLCRVSLSLCRFSPSLGCRLSVFEVSLGFHGAEDAVGRTGHDRGGYLLSR